MPLKRIRALFLFLWFNPTRPPTVFPIPNCMQQVSLSQKFVD